MSSARCDRAPIVSELSVIRPETVIETHEQGDFKKAVSFLIALATNLF